jgi:hypothetical protein
MIRKKMILPVQVGMAADEKSELMIDQLQITTPLQYDHRGALVFFERRKFVVRLSRKLLGDAFLCRICTDVKRTWVTFLGSSLPF